ncbi:MAG: hypothetical protein MJ099_05645, partial [Clostridia bacterium]|nr:hypothetical protein [Clostridia bacterium]
AYCGGWWYDKDNDYELVSTDLTVKNGAKLTADSAVWAQGDVTIDGTLIGDIRVVRSPDEPLLFMLSADHAGTVHAFDTVALRLEILDRDGQHTVIPLSFDFETPMVFDAPEAEVLAEAEADGLTVQLLAVEEGGYGQDLSLRLNIINDTDEARSELSSVDCLFNGCLVSTAQCIETIPAHGAVLAPLDCVFAMTTGNDTLLCRDLNGYYEIEHVEAIRLVGDEIDFELTLEDAYDLTWLGENGFTATLIADDEVTVGLAEIAFSAGEARLILDLTNNGDEPLSLCLTDGLWDDVAAEGISAPILLQPGERALTAMTLPCEAAEGVPERFTVSLSDGETAILTLQFDLDESLSVTDGIVPPERYELTIG